MVELPRLLIRIVDSLLYQPGSSRKPSLSTTSVSPSLESVCEERDLPHLVGRNANASVARELLLKYAGTYEVSPKALMRVVLDQDYLTIETGTGSKYRLDAQSGTVFAPRGANGIIEFFTNTEGAVTHLTIGGIFRTTTAVRRTRTQADQ